MTCAWPNPPCEEWDPIEMGMLDYCEEHAAEVERTRVVLIRTHLMRGKALEGKPLRVGSAPFAPGLVGLASTWRNWKAPVAGSSDRT